MPTVDFKALAAAPGANVVDQATWIALLAGAGALVNGFQAGVAPSAQVNKALRQATVMSAALAQAISDLLGVDVLDDGDLPGLTAKIKSAFAASVFQVGDVMLSMAAANTPVGWVFLNNGTIGNVGSGATNRANLDCLALYTLLWELPNGDAWCPIVGARGGNAASDWAALKAITLPKVAGRVVGVRNSGASDPLLPVVQRGGFKGEETHVITSEEMPVHIHDLYTGGGGYVGGVPGLGDNTGAPLSLRQAVTNTGAINPAGGLAGMTQALSLIQPSVYFNAFMKL